MEKQKITVQVTINAPIETVWRRWTSPEDIVKWNHASDDWHSPRAVNDLRKGGRFNYRMEAKDGSNGFDFEGAYDEVTPYKIIAYTMDDKRQAQVIFTTEGKTTKVVEIFDAENTYPIELQHDGWQAILNNFKKHVEFWHQ